MSQYCLSICSREAILEARGVHIWREGTMPSWGQLNAADCQLPGEHASVPGGHHSTLQAASQHAKTMGQFGVLVFYCHNTVWVINQILICSL